MTVQAVKQVIQVKAISDNVAAITIPGLVIQTRNGISVDTPPAQWDSTGTPGTAVLSDDFLYLCVSENVWLRIAGAKEFVDTNVASNGILLLQNIASQGIEFVERVLNLAKGSLISADTDHVPIVLEVGADGKILSADSNELSGLKWIDAPSGGGIADISGQDLSIADNSVSQFITADDIPTIPADISDLNDKLGKLVTDLSELTDTTGKIPTATSDLSNDSDFIVDGSYVHTDNNYTTDEKNKLSGIAAGAEVNVNADWSANSGDAQILNKPPIPSKTSDLSNDSSFTTLTAVKEDTDIADSLSTKHSHSNATALNAVSGTNTGDQDLSGKVDKEAGKGLSTNDYTTAEQSKLSGIEASANNYTHPTGDGNSHVPANSTTNAGKVLTASGTAGTYPWEQAGSARWTVLSNYTATPASTSTITMGTDQTATVKVGMPVKYTISSVVYYGIITAMTSNLMTIAGAPLGGDITALSVGTPEMVEQVIFVVNGLFATATDTAVLLNQLGMRFIWNKGTAHCVQLKANQTVADTGSENRVNAYIGSTAANTICTANTNVGLDLDSTVANWVSTGDINTSYYTVNKLDAIELSVTKVGNGDSQNLTTILVFVLE